MLIKASFITENYHHYFIVVIITIFFLVIIVVIIIVIIIVIIYFFLIAFACYSRISYHCFPLFTEATENLRSASPTMYESDDEEQEPKMPPSKVEGYLTIASQGSFTSHTSRIA